MGIFSKQVFFDEVSINNFWKWFKNNQNSDIWQINKEMGVRLLDIVGGQNTTAWYEMGWDMGRNKAYITFWADASKHTRECFKKMIELAPSDIKEKWMLRVEN